jgi:hypothetical protein
MAWSDASLSPDGRQVLLWSPGLTEAVDLDNGTARRYPPWRTGFWPDPVSNMLWQPDGSRWVELNVASVSPLRLASVVRNVHGSQPLGGVPFSCPIGAASLDSVGARLLGFISPHRVLALPESSLIFSHRNGLRLFEFTVTGQPHVREYSIHLPKESRALNVALSPDGLDLMMTLQIVNRPTLTPLQRLLANWLPNVRSKSNRVVALYTVRRDGSDWHYLGTMPSTDDNDRTYGDRCFRLRWLPSGQQVSFIYHDTLWKVDAQ